MPATLYEALLNNRAAICLSIIDRVRNSGALHYRMMETGVLQERTERLVDSFLDSIKGRPSVFIAHMERIAAQRISEGIFLHEIQTVLHSLEERTWTFVVDLVPQPEQVRCLSRITGTIGAAKDQIAHVYLQHLEKAESRVIVLQERLNELAKGTDSPPVCEEDLNAEMQ